MQIMSLKLVSAHPVQLYVSTLTAYFIIISSPIRQTTPESPRIMSPSTSDGNYSANKSIHVNASNVEMESPPLDYYLKFS